jgi:hypothetical protein
MKYEYFVKYLSAGNRMTKTNYYSTCKVRIDVALGVHNRRSNLSARFTSESWETKKRETEQ